MACGIVAKQHGDRWVKRMGKGRDVLFRGLRRSRDVSALSQRNCPICCELKLREHSVGEW
jgi:hypothetical protein